MNADSFIVLNAIEFPISGIWKIFGEKNFLLSNDVHHYILSIFHRIARVLLTWYKYVKKLRFSEERFRNRSFRNRFLKNDFEIVLQKNDFDLSLWLFDSFAPIFIFVTEF